jgi:flagellar hook-basal body complex protein FliE
MAVPPVGGATGSSYISALAQLQRQEVTGAAATSAASSATRAGASGGVSPGTAARGADFADAVGKSLSQVEAMDRIAADKAVKAATGDLTDVHDYVIAATKAQTATELTTTVRNKALDAFNEIMRMPL